MENMGKYQLSWPRLLHIHTTHAHVGGIPHACLVASMRASLLVRACGFALICVTSSLALLCMCSFSASTQCLCACTISSHLLYACDLSYALACGARVCCFFSCSLHMHGKLLACAACLCGSVAHEFASACYTTCCARCMPFFPCDCKLTGNYPARIQIFARFLDMRFHIWN